MGLLDRWRFAVRAATEPELTTFSETEPRPVAEVITQMLAASGRVTRSQALSIPAVLKGRNMVCSIATLPLQQLNPARSVEPSSLLKQIDPQVPNVVTLAQTVEDLLFEGISWWQKLAVGYGNFPLSARHIDESSVSLEPPPGYNLQHLPSDIEPSSVVWVEGKPVRGDSMIRFDSPNPPVLKVAGRSIRRAIAFDKAAAMYADDPKMLGYFTPTEGADPVDDDEVKSLLQEWVKSRQENSTGYVPAALKYNEMTFMSPADLQLVQLQQRVALDIANALGVDPEDLGISTTSRTYQNATDRRQDRINEVLAPYMRAITDRLSMDDVTRRGYRVEFDLSDYMKADPKTRWETYEKAITLKVKTVDEVRAEEDIQSLTPAQKHELNPPAQQPVPVQPALPGGAMSSTASVTFARESGLEFEADISATFTVDENARTITGLAVPYGPIAKSGGRRWRFGPGSVKWSDTGRVKLLREHDHSLPLGKAIKLTETAAGLVASFKVARGKAGDEALALAADGVLDGLSIGVDFADGDFSADPSNPGVNLVKRSALREVSLTAMPAFDDSRLTSVAASSTGSDLQMTDKATEAPTAPAVEAASFSAEDIKALVTEAVKAAIPAVEETAAVVNPNRTATFQVDEAPLYRFNGERGQYDFSTDMVAGSKGDGEAMKRVNDFVTAQFAVTQANVATLNPHKQRPDLYVDQLDYTTPIWDAISKGTIADNTPFVLPKFSSSSGLVAAHTEGTEPTAGAFTATPQTITPSAVSGKVEINREAWDQGGNPQLSGLIWRQITRAYYEALESSAVTLLDGLSLGGSVITLTTAGADSALEGELTGHLATLQYQRGGARMRDFFVQIDLFKKLIAAKDGSGRKLFPVVGAQNATGTTSGDFGGVMVGSYLARPSWALAASGTVAANSYLFNREDVSGWATAPQRLDFQYQVKDVTVGVWGYKALACTRVEGVRRFVYDPV